MSSHKSFATVIDTIWHRCLYGMLVMWLLNGVCMCVCTPCRLQLIIGQLNPPKRNIVYSICAQIKIPKTLFQFTSFCSSVCVWRMVFSVHVQTKTHKMCELENLEREKKNHLILATIELHISRSLRTCVACNLLFFIWVSIIDGYEHWGDGYEFNQRYK